MNHKKLRIVFSGTPDFASICLEQLIIDGFNIVAVLTAPDRKKGRGQVMAASPVKECAIKNDIPVLQPTNLKDIDFQKQLASYAADLGVVVAFRMLPEKVWNMPDLGTVNLHASLLPNYRGAAPINWALMNGEKKTGITTFFLKHEIDTGDIILQKEVEIGDEMDAGQLHDVLAIEGSHLLSKTIASIESNSYEPKPQNNLVSKVSDLKNAPKIFKEDCKINWSEPAQDIYNKIRGLSPMPVAWTTLENAEGRQLNFRIFKSKMTFDVSKDKAGKIMITENDLFISCSDFNLKILSIQLEGKQKMDIASFLRGFKLEEYTIKT